MSRSQTATICDSKTDNDCAIRRLTTMCYDAPLGNHTRLLNQTKPPTLATMLSILFLAYVGRIVLKIQSYGFDWF